MTGGNVSSIQRLILLILVTASYVNAQTWPEQVGHILSQPIQTPDITAFQLRRYLMKHVPALSVSHSAEQWTGEARRLRQNLFDNVVFHGWPKEWVDAPAKFDDLGLIESGKGYRLRKLRYEIIPGFQSTAILYEPERPEGKVPAILNLCGHVGPPGKAVEFEQKRCINFAKRGMLALSLEWLGMGELSQKENDHWFGAHLDLVGANELGLFYLAMRKGLDYLDAHPSVDHERLGVTGFSGGGWQTIVLSSLDERVSVAVPVAGYDGLASRIELGDAGDIEQNPTDFFVGQDFTHLTAMRAPRPTLLIYNAEDDVCFRAPLIKPYIFDAVKPFFRLYGGEEAFAWHENVDPGNHNYQVDNRVQAYRFFTKYFNLPSAEGEIPSDAEIRSFDELVVGLPKDNLTILGLAKKLAAQISRSAPPSEEADNTTWAAAERAKLRRLVRYNQVTVNHPWAVGNTKNKGLETRSYSFELSNGLSATGVWLKAIRTADSAPITIVLHDKGMKSAASEVSARVNRGEQVMAIDLLFTNLLSAESSGAPAYAEMLAATGDRPIGIEAAQLIGVTEWLREISGAPMIRIESTGIRNQVVALTASALQPNLFSQLVIREGMRSLSYLLNEPVIYQAAPDLFCLDLFKEFDLDRLAAVAQPTRVIHEPHLEISSK
jgi:dienelactone hydrolase